MEGNPSYTPGVLHDLEDPAVVGGKDDLEERNPLEGTLAAIEVPDLEPALPELPVPPDAVQELMNWDHGPAGARDARRPGSTDDPAGTYPSGNVVSVTIHDGRVKHSAPERPQMNRLTLASSASAR
jgi:hypothetical protein